MEEKYLVDICNPKQWKTIPKSELIEDGEFPVYGANGIIGRYNKYNHEKPTVLITCRGATCGNIHIAVPKAYINGNAMALDNLNEIICKKEYLYYFLQYYDISKIISGTAQPQITITGLKKVKVKLYSINKQEKIVNELNKINKLIELKEIQLEELQKLIKSQFVEMFGDPIINEKNWNVDTIKNVAPRTKYVGKFDAKVWILNLDMIESGTGNIIEYMYEDLEKIKSSTCTFNEEYVLYSKLRPYLNKVVVPIRKGYATSEMIPLKPDITRVEKQFLAYLLRSEQFVNYISLKTIGAKMPRVSMEIFMKFNLILPPLSLQNQFSEIVKQIDKQKFEIEKSLKETQELYESLMEKYFG